MLVPCICLFSAILNSLICIMNLDLIESYRIHVLLSVINLAYLFQLPTGRDIVWPFDLCPFNFMSWNFVAFLTDSSGMSQLSRFDPPPPAQHSCTLGGYRNCLQSEKARGWYNLLQFMDLKSLGDFHFQIICCGRCFTGQLFMSNRVHLDQAVWVLECHLHLRTYLRMTSKACWRLSVCSQHLDRDALWNWFQLLMPLRYFYSIAK